MDGVDVEDIIHTTEADLGRGDKVTARGGELQLEVGRDSGQKTGGEEGGSETHFVLRRGAEEHAGL